MAKKRVYDMVVAERRGEGDDAEVFWHRVGVVLEGDKGLSFKLTMVPTAWDGWGYLMEPRDKDDAGNGGGRGEGGRSSQRRQDSDRRSRRTRDD